MSLANAPVYSNGDKTVTITLKRLEVVGRPAGHRERPALRHRPDQGRGQGVPVELVRLRPGPLPGQPGEHLAAERSDAGDEPQRAGQPGWFTRLPRLAVPDAGRAWAKTSATGPIVTTWDRPGGRDEDLQLPHRAGQVRQHVRDQPAVAGRRRAVQALGVQRHHRRLHHGAEHVLRRPARHAACPPSRPFRSPRRPPSSTPSRRAASTSATSRLRRAAAAAAGRARLRLLRHAGLRRLLRDYNFKDKTGDFDNIVAQLYFRQAMAHLEDQQGWISAFMHGAGGPAYGPIPAYPSSPYLPGTRRPTRTRSA